MSKYVDVNYFAYDTISECLKKESQKKLLLKESLQKENRLLLIDKNNGNIIECIENIQSLYLYPLSILDYSSALNSFDNVVQPVMINIINFNSKINYIEKFKEINTKYLKNIEILISDKYNDYDFIKIIDLVDYFSKNNLKISLNFKTINIDTDMLVKLSSYCDYFKIFMPTILNTDLVENFTNKMKIVCSNKKENSVINIKTYLDEEQSLYYESILKKFSELKIDIFQVSKELIPMRIKINPFVSNDVQKNIRNLEKEYNKLNLTRFISVKDITTLYYPRFELDERNSRKCYASVMKPYLYNEYLLPCKVNKILENVDNWYISKINKDYNLEHISKCGSACDDCASIFENDILYQIDKIIHNYKKNDLDFILEVGGEKC